MPTPTKGPRLGGGPAHERLILANLATSLFEHDSITTTEAKAKRLRPLAERLVTFAKRGDLHARRRVLSVISDKGVVHRLFTEIAPDMAERPGGYTRITKIGARKGDNAPMAVIELVREPLAKKATVKEAEAATKRSAKQAEAKEAAVETKAAETKADDAAKAEESTEADRVAPRPPRLLPTELPAGCRSPRTRTARPRRGLHRQGQRRLGQVPRGRWPVVRPDGGRVLVQVRRRRRGRWLHEGRRLTQARTTAHRAAHPSGVGGPLRCPALRDFWPPDAARDGRSGALVRPAWQTSAEELARHWLHVFQRLVPAAVLVMVATLAVSAVVLPPTRWGDLLQEGLAILGYVQNWLLAHRAVDYYAADQGVASPLQHFWSLSLQGQVFVLWPLLFVGLGAVARRTGTALRPLVGALFGLVFVVSLAYSVHTTSERQAFAYFDGAARLWEFAFGTLLALALARVTLPRWVGVGRGLPGGGTRCHPCRTGRPIGLWCDLRGQKCGEAAVRTGMPGLGRCGRRRPGGGSRG